MLTKGVVYLRVAAAKANSKTISSVVTAAKASSTLEPPLPFFDLAKEVNDSSEIRSNAYMLSATCGKNGPSSGASL